MYSPYTSSVTKPLYRAIQLIWYILYIIEALLALRFFLKLFGANPAAGFTEFIYRVSHPLIYPFMNVFRVSTAASGAVFEWPTLLAMIFYFLLFYALIRLLLVGRPVSISEASEKLEDEDKKR